MKKIILIVLFLAPLFGIAQDKLIGKTQKEVNAYFKTAHIPLYYNSTADGKLSDEFKKGHDVDITCYYNKSNICTQEIAILGVATVAKSKANFASAWVKLSDNSWADKEKTMKVQLVVMPGLNEAFYNYIAFNDKFESM